jgi:hypothetical protein
LATTALTPSHTPPTAKLRMTVDGNTGKCHANGKASADIFHGIKILSILLAQPNGMI